MVTDKTLSQLYEEHTGKVSDKWSLYLTEYDRIFGEYRNKSIRLLEIGIQNGGSLDIWSKYFQNGQRFIGCDINPDCSRLQYNDPRIELVIGNANIDSVENSIVEISPEFDIVIDDGSHVASDIIKTFARYFPKIVDGGIYIAEDLHCSYWQEYGGGLFAPHSSISFFKRLADIVNHEHWGENKKGIALLADFFEKFEFEMDETALEQVHSIEFINSMCVVRKFSSLCNRLTKRVVAGTIEEVFPGLRELALEIPLQNKNPWSSFNLLPNEDLYSQLQELDQRNTEIANLTKRYLAANAVAEERAIEIASLAERYISANAVAEARAEEIASLAERYLSANAVAEERAIEIASLLEKLKEMDTTFEAQSVEINRLKKQIASWENSLIWRIKKIIK